MCPFCKGVGGITVEESWGIRFVACEHPKCDFDREKEWKKTQAIIDKFRKETREREGA